ncbi:glycan biosynthesis hexose transferase WsfD [Paenibacillus sp. strain BS8-2]
MKKWIQAERIYLTVAGVVAIVLLFAGPFIGVADNGDFLRVMGTAGLNYYDAAEVYEDRFFGYAHALFAYDDFLRGFYPSTQMILVVIARLIAGIVNGAAFDIRVLGAIYTALLLAGGYFVVRAMKSSYRIITVLLVLLMIVVFTDIAYLAYFNSLFGEPVSFVFLLLTMGIGLTLLKRSKLSPVLLVIFYVSVLFLTCSKTQNAPIGIGFALLGLRFVGLDKERRLRGWIIGLSAFTMLASVTMYVAAPKDFKDINIYQTVFFGILNNSPDVKGDLEALGLPQHLSVLAGTNYFQSGTVIPQNDPSLKEGFYDRMSHFDVLLFYMSHPGRLLDKMSYAAENSMSIRPYYLGNFEKTAGKERGALTFQFSSWSEFKHKIMPNELWFIVAFAAAYITIVVMEWRKAAARQGKIKAELFLLLALTGIFAFLIPILGDGLADMGKHLFLFNVCFDMMVVTAIVWVVHRVFRLLWR